MCAINKPAILKDESRKFFQVLFESTAYGHTSNTNNPADIYTTNLLEKKTRAKSYMRYISLLKQLLRTVSFLDILVWLNSSEKFRHIAVFYFQSPVSLLPKANALTELRALHSYFSDVTAAYVLESHLSASRNLVTDNSFGPKRG